MIAKNDKWYCEKCKTEIPKEALEYKHWNDGDDYVDTELVAKCPKCGEENSEWV